MFPFFKKFFHMFFYDELAFVRWMRGFFLSFGASGMAFAKEIAESEFIEAPGLIKIIKILGVICFFIGGAITAGERNKKEELGPSDGA